MALFLAFFTSVTGKVWKNEARTMDAPMEKMSIYQRLPDELKLKIWEFSIMTPGVHHLKFTKRGSFRPHSENATDPSAWRQRLVIKGVNRLSWDALSPLLRRRRILIFEDTAWRHHTHTSENGIRVLVDGSADLVLLYPERDNFVLRFASDASMSIRALQDLQRLGIKWKIPQRKSSTLEPFDCLCRDKMHGRLRFCPVALGNLIARAPDLKIFYFVFSLCGGDIVPYLPGEGGQLDTQLQAEAMREVQRGKKRDARGVLKNMQASTRRAKKHTRNKDLRPAAERIRDVLERFRAINKRDNLESFQDRRGMYFEVSRHNTKDVLKSHDRIWDNIKDIRSGFEAYVRGRPNFNGDNKKRLLAIDFKFLVLIGDRYITIPEGAGGK
ncbi:hypothetical protein F4810DRAFT_670981 [Camillea tinctor]|nr:hypothetical protein F4810DRAFT_670981 [Camillea tinctor]